MIRIMIARLLPLLLLAFSTASDANPELPPPEPQNAEKQLGCELHIWPAPGLESSTDSWIHNQTHNQILRDARGKELGLADAIPPRAQLDAIVSLDLNDAFHLDGAQVIPHPDPLPPSPTAAPVVRHAPATTPCYAEFVIKRLVFAKSPVAGGVLQAFFIFRWFRQDDVQSFTSMAETPLTIFPWKNPEDQERGKAELSEALRSDLLIFAKYSQKPFVRRR